MAKARRYMLGIGLALLVAGPAFGQQAPAPVATPSPATDLPRVTVTTTAGTMIVEVDTKRAPVTGANFLRYVDGKRLDGTGFYRVIRVAPDYGFVQFGPMGDPKKSLPPIKHEPTSRTGLTHSDGVLSLARLAPGTGRGEFTIMVGDQSAGMDARPGVPPDGQGYAAFGRVVEGRDVLVRILDNPVDPQKNRRGAYKGEMPAEPVRILSARRVAAR